MIVMIDSQKQISRAIHTLCQWMDEHFDRFKPAAGIGLESFSHLKPFGELALMLYSFSNPKRRISNPELLGWLCTSGKILHHRAEKFGDEINWKKMNNTIAQNPEVGSALLIFPALKVVTGNSTYWDYYVNDLLSQAGSVYAAAYPDLAFARDLSGLGNCHQQAIAKLFDTMDDQDEDIHTTTSTLSLITHYVFLATKMGFRNIDLPAEQSSRLKGCLVKALELNIEKKNFDLTGEILLCMNWLNFKNVPSYHVGLELLFETISMYGYVPGSSRNSKNNDVFKQNYHASLMALAAIGHASMIENLN